MAASIEELRRRLKEQEETKTKSSGDSASYPFWNIPENSTAVLRFLPDGNDENPFFWQERTVINLPFASKNSKDNKVTVQVPCMHMYGEQCPIINETRTWWGTDLEATAKIYYKKVSFVYQGFVVNSPLQEENPPANPIRRFLINKELHNMIKAALMDPELDTLPTDYSDGLDFRINKTKGPKFVTYETSAWSRKNRSLSEEEIAAIEEHGLFNLKDYLPKKPDEEALVAIMEMFEASVAGEEYDESRWAKFYKPQGFQGSQKADKKETTEEETPQVITKAKKVEVTKEVVEDDDLDDGDDYEEVSVGESKPVSVKPKVTESVESAKPTKSPSELLAELKRRKQSQ